MKIAINTTSAVYGGGVTYLNQLLERLSELDISNDYYIFTVDSSAHRFNFIKNKNWKYFRFRYLQWSLLRVFWEQFILPVYLRREKIDILYSPANTTSILADCKKVVMMQNMEPFYRKLYKKQNFYRQIRLYVLKILSVLSMKRADAIIFISDYARKFLQLKYDFNFNKTFLIYHGRDENFSIRWQNQTYPFKELGLKKNYILFVSNLQKYKNVLELIKAYSIIRRKLIDVPQLIIAGRFSDHEYYHELKREIERQKSSQQVLLLDEVSYYNLPLLYQNAFLFVFPSSCENCPNILIEAMSAGLPIVCSDRMSMPEICQDAVIYFDPDDPDDIADKILKVLQSDDLRQTLREKTLKRVQDFSWDKTAKETLEVFEKVYCS